MILQWTTVCKILSGTDLGTWTQCLLKACMQGEHNIDCLLCCLLHSTDLLPSVHLVSAGRHLSLCCTCRLSERLGSHSQLGKQRALSKLVTALLACKLDSQQLEPHHNLLSLVYWLARRPLESVYIPLEEARDSDAGLTSPPPSATCIKTYVVTVYSMSSNLYEPIHP